MHALDINLNLIPNTKTSYLENSIAGHIIDEAEIIGLYSKNNYTGLRVPAKTCQASRDLATKLKTMYIFSPNK